MFYHVVETLRAAQDLSMKVELNNVETSAAAADIAGSHFKLLSAVQHLQVALGEKFGNWGGAVSECSEKP